MSKKLIDLARTLGEELAASDEFKRYNTAKENLKADKELKGKINEFKVQKMILDMEAKKEENQREESLLDVLAVRVDELYRSINENPVMVEFNSAEEEMNNLLTAINATIGSYVADKDEPKGGEGSCSPDMCASCKSACAHSKQ